MSSVDSFSSILGVAADAVAAGVAGVAGTIVTKNPTWGVEALAAGGYVATMWLEEQAWRKAFLIAGNAPVVFCGLWFSVSAARRGAVAVWVTLRTAKDVVGAAAAVAKEAVGMSALKTSKLVCGGIFNASDALTPTQHDEASLVVASPLALPLLTPPSFPPPSGPVAVRRFVPQTALSTLGALARAAPRPGLGIHLIGYVTALALTGTGVWLWALRPSKSALWLPALTSFSELLYTLSLPVAAGCAVAASEYAADAEDGVGIWAAGGGGVPGDTAPARRALTAAILASGSAAVWGAATNAALSRLETKLADAVAAAAKVVTAATSLLTRANWLNGVTTAGATSYWTAGPLGAAAVGVSCFLVSFAASKVAKNKNTVLSPPPDDGHDDDDDNNTSEPKPLKGERMVFFVWRVLDA